MQRQIFSDVTVNIDIEKVIKSPEFGCPLLVVQDGDFTKNSIITTPVYIKCSDEEDAIEKITNVFKGNVTPLKNELSDDWSSGMGGSVTFNFINGEDATGIETGFFDGEKHTYIKVSESQLGISFSNANINNAVLKFGVAISKTDSNGDESFSTSANNAAVTLFKNGEVYSTYYISKDKPLMITNELGKISESDKFEIRSNVGVYMYDLTCFEYPINICEAISTFYSQEDAPDELAVYIVGSYSPANYDEIIEPLYSEDWRSAICMSSSQTFINDLSIAAEKKEDRLIFLLNGKDDEAVNISSYTGRDRTIIYANNSDKTKNGAKTITALVAYATTKPVGSITYKNIALKGVPVADITPRELKALHKVNVNSYVTKCGVGVTSEGKTMSGEYIDIIDSRDWIILQIEYNVQKLLIDNPKIPYTDTGINLIRTEVINTLQSAYKNGIIAEDAEGNPAYNVDFAARSETSKADRAERIYKGGKFSFDLAGAVHEATINGVINI